MSEDKGHKPTKKKLEKARKEGKVFRSPLLTQSAVLCTWLCLIYSISYIVWVRLQKMVNYCFISGQYDLSRIMTESMWMVSFTVIGALMISVASGIAAELLQSEFRFFFQFPVFKSERLNLITGIKRIFEGFKRAIGEVLKCAILVFCFFLFFKDLIPEVVNSVTVEAATRFLLLRGLWWKYVRLILGLLAALSFIDYAVRRFRYYRELSMSVQELKDEHREDEGDQIIKGYRRSLHEALAMRDLTRRIRKAKLVIVKRNH